MVTTQRLPFKPAQRLLSNSDFQSIFNSANLRVGLGEILILANPNTLSYSRLGIVAPKKVLKRAVDRNRIKRLVREAFRTNQHALIADINGSDIAMDIVVLSRKGIGELNNRTIVQKMSEGFTGLQRIAKKYIKT